MLQTIRLIIALLVLIVISPQIPLKTGRFNIVLQKFHESGFFVDYVEAEWFLKNLTWFLIFSFLFISLF